MHIDAYSSSASRKFRTTSFAIAQLWHGLAMTRSLLLLVSIDISEARPLWQLWQRLLWEEDISEPTLADLAVTLSNYCRLSLVLHPALLHIELDRTGIICFSTLFSSLFLSVLFLTLIFALVRFCPCATSSSATWQLSICACVQVTMRPDRKLGTQRSLLRVLRCPACTTFLPANSLDSSGCSGMFRFVCDTHCCPSILPSALTQGPRQCLQISRRCLLFHVPVLKLRLQDWHAAGCCWHWRLGSVCMNWHMLGIILQSGPRMWTFWLKVKQAGW